MQVIETLESIKGRLDGCCVTIGNFDGVHLGHDKIIESAKIAAAKAGNCPVVALTFDPHPVVILHPEKAPAVLTPLVLKKALLAGCGVDYLVVIKDSYKFLTMSPQDFVSDFLMKNLSPKVVVEGADFNFGYGRSGNAETLCSLGKKNGFDVIIVEDLETDLDGHKQRISSTLVRHLLAESKISQTSAVLGRYYRLMGKIVKGRGKGTELGFPTANIEPTNQLTPAEGVYAGFVSIADSAEKLVACQQKIPAAFSLGRAKTFITDHPLLIEAHLFSKDVEDLYGKYLAMDFVDFVRGQRRFESEAQLKQQIDKDCKKIKNILKDNNGNN